jgi:hypothetical protein
MAIVERRRVHCPLKHEDAIIIKKDDGSIVVKCVRSKECGDTCPYLTDPNYKSPFKRAPQFKAS